MICQPAPILGLDIDGKQTLSTLLRKRIDHLLAVGGPRGLRHLIRVRRADREEGGLGEAPDLQIARRRRGGRRGPKRLTMPGQTETRHWEIIKMLGGDFRPLLYFVFSRKMSEQFARELNRRGPQDGFTSPDEKKKIKERVDQFDANRPCVDIAVPSPI